MSEESPVDLDSIESIDGTVRMRFDLVKLDQSLDETTGNVIFHLVPDPRRYDRVEEDGKLWYLDKYFQTLISPEDFIEAHTPTLPTYFSKRTIESAPKYAAKRKAAISSELQVGVHEPPEEKPRIHDRLDTNAPKREMAFLSVDICGSTSYRHRDARGFDRVYEIVLEELGTLVGQFQGSLLKATGDGFIAYIDGPGINVLVDNTIDLGGSLLCMLEEAINPAIEAHGLQPIAIRVGADFGYAQIREIKVAATGFIALDITSDALNRAVKIEQSAIPNTFRIGYSLYRLAHVQWLERSFSVDFDGYHVGIPGYKVFEVR